jgi:hypothetical protein
LMIVLGNTYERFGMLRPSFELSHTRHQAQLAAGAKQTLATVGCNANLGQHSVCAACRLCQLWLWCNRFVAPLTLHSVLRVVRLGTAL